MSKPKPASELPANWSPVSGEPLTQERLGDLQILCREATPGPWFAQNPDDSFCMNMFCVSPTEYEPSDEGDLKNVVCVTMLQTGVDIGCLDETGKSPVSAKWRENTAFIAEARTAVPQLVVEVLALRSQLEAAERLAEERRELLVREVTTNRDLRQCCVRYIAYRNGAQLCIDEIADQMIALIAPANLRPSNQPPFHSQPMEGTGA